MVLTKEGTKYSLSGWLEISTRSMQKAVREQTAFHKIQECEKYAIETDIFQRKRKLIRSSLYNKTFRLLKIFIAASIKTYRNYR